MKITCILPETTHIYGSDKTIDINSGVILGWRNLPTDIQKIITWIGVDLTKSFPEITIKGAGIEFTVTLDELGIGDRAEKVSSIVRSRILSAIEENIRFLEEKLKATKQLLM